MIPTPSQGGTEVRKNGIVKQLRNEIDRVERELLGLNAALTAFIGAYSGKTKPASKGRKFSVKVRAKMAASQRARWAKVNAKKKAA
jgi:hypothetical protein